MTQSENADKEAPITVEADKDNNKDKEKKVEDLSEEDISLKEGLELAVVRLQEDDDSLHKLALDHLVSEIRSATASMTSVPKPLKFLRPHYESLKIVYNNWAISHPMKKSMADVLSVLAMTMAAPNSRECLAFKLEGTKVDISSWGHEYVRSLAGEISEEYNQRVISTAAEDDVDYEDLSVLVDDILPFQMSHNAEAEAVDLLMEVRQLKKLTTANVVDNRNYERVCLYLIRSASYVVDPEDLDVLYETAFRIYLSQKKYCDALRVAMKVDSEEHIQELFSEEIGASEVIKKQMALILGRDRRTTITLQDESLNELVGNSKLSDHFLAVATSLDVLTVKGPEDIYKTHLAEGPLGMRRANNTAAVDSARANLASTYVNAFVNAGYCKDKLILNEEDSGSSWLFKNKQHGIMSASASLGMVMMWNVDEGLNQLDKFLHDNDEYVKAGACLGIGITCNGTRNESDPAFALLCDYLEESATVPSTVRSAAISGLGLAYAASNREEIQASLEPIVSNGTSISEVSLAALSLGLVFVASCNDDVGSIILQRLMESSDTDLNQPIARYLCLGLALLYLGKGEKAEAVLEAVKTIEHPRGKYAALVIDICAYAGSGNVLKVQEMLRLCADHITVADDKAAATNASANSTATAAPATTTTSTDSQTTKSNTEKAECQTLAVLGISLIAAGEEVGTEMALRTFEHLLHYGELPVRRGVPLAIAMLYASNPEYAIVDQLSRLSHDQDADLSQSAILALGIVSAGSNNSRVANLLRQLADFYAREANHLFVVRIAQGLNAMAKGLMTLSPFHSDRLLMNAAGLSGLITLLFSALDMKHTLLDKYHFFLYYLSISMNPRFLYTVDADLQPIKASVRVGQAVETVGQAGRPKTITGFQTHTTPALLGFKDRAELANREYEAFASVFEGVLVLEKRPEETNTINISTALASILTR